jgi:predicted dehydrogenase
MVAWRRYENRRDWTRIHGLDPLANIPDAQLAAVMDVDEKRLSGDLSGIQGNIGGPAQMMDFSGVKKYRSVEEIAGDPDVDATDVCLPTFLHAPVTLQLLRAGKHVLVEKPMALDGAPCDQMVAEAEKQDRVLMVAQVLRFAPAYQALQGYMQDG